MNTHIIWLAHVRTGPPKKKSQPGRAEISFINQGELVAMKTLSGCRALRCDKHQFCDKMTVST